MGIYGKKAGQIMALVNQDLVEKFATVIDFLADNPDLKQKKLQLDDPTSLEKAARAFAKGREPSAPSMPSTRPDPMVGFIMEKHFGVSTDKITEALQHHNLAMAAENKIGQVLEAYIASELEPKGWAWCSGSLVKAVDFVVRDGDCWHALQVKNRSNSENSSSSAIREGTIIEKWYRTHHSKECDMWREFPLGQVLSEESFAEFFGKFLQRFSRPRL